jgi:hypothetical protein
MSRLGLLLSFCLLSFCLSWALAQTCGPLNITLDVPQMCNPSYLVSNVSQNSTGNDLIFDVFSSLPQLPSLACAEAFVAYYCSLYYPECNSTTDICGPACSALVLACANDVQKFSHSALSLPTADRCDPLASQCGPVPNTDLAAFYPECDYAIVNLTAFSLARTPTEIICSPRYLAPKPDVRLGASAYTESQKVFETLAMLDVNLKSEKEVGIEEWMYTCIKSFSSFHCAHYFPKCSSSGARPPLPLCRSVCEQLVKNCQKLVEYFPKEPKYLQIPSTAECSKFPTSSCAEMTINDTSLKYFYDSEPPTPRISSTTYFYGIVYPPGGPATGAGVGVGVLLGLLLIILGLAILMKRQDSR